MCSSLKWLEHLQALHQRVHRDARGPDSCMHMPPVSHPWSCQQPDTTAACDWSKGTTAACRWSKELAPAPKGMSSVLPPGPATVRRWWDTLCTLLFSTSSMPVLHPPLNSLPAAPAEQGPPAVNVQGGVDEVSGGC